MKNTKINVYKSLKTNNRVVYLVVITSTIISLSAIFFVMKIINDADKYIYATSTNEKLIPLEKIEKKEVEYIYKKAHIGLFIENFYDIDQWNYEKRIEKSFWLIDDISGKKLYKYYQSSGHYNMLIQSTSSQSVTDINPVIDLNNNLKVKFIVEINKPNQDHSKKYIITCRGKLKKVSSNYPLNPYGYLIYDFVEVSKEPII